MDSIDQLCSFSERIAVVTGAGSGIGRAVAARFAAAGARLLLTDRDEEGLTATVNSLPAGAAVATATGDVTDWEAGPRIARAALDAHGAIDVLVNCAGLFPSAPALTLDEGHWDALLDVNLKGAMRMTQAVGAHLGTRPGSAIVNIASVQGLRPTPGKAAYAASKAGLIALTQVLARELAPAVRVNAVAPGPILTEAIAARIAAAGAPSGGAGRQLSQVPLGRFGSPDEVARVVLFLASDAAAYVTGATWPVDGGSLLV